MSLLEAMVARAADRKLEFLLVGGHAVIVHGYQRTTFDVDLAIRRADRERWLEVTRDLGFVLFHEGPNFLQFNPPPGEPLPVDLMFTSDDTFAKLRAGALPNPQGAAYPLVVCLRHLLAMKCHAIKHGHSGRIVKDADDVIHLFQANRLDPQQAEWRELVLQFGTAELYEKLQRICQPG